jgi:hypothetical protein
MRIASMRADSGVVIASYGRVSNDDFVERGQHLLFGIRRLFPLPCVRQNDSRHALCWTIFNEAVVITYRTVDTQEASPSNNGQAELCRHAEGRRPIALGV